MHLSEAFPSPFFKWEDIDGTEPTVVISGAEIELLGKDRKLVLQFQGKQKRFVCNRTNGNTIELTSSGIKITDLTGNVIDMSSSAFTLTAKVPLKIDASGQTVTVIGNTIDLQKA